MGFLRLCVLSAFIFTVPVAVARQGLVQRRKAMLPPDVVCKIGCSFHCGSVRIAIPLLLPAFAQRRLSIPACVSRCTNKIEISLGTERHTAFCASALFRATFVMLQTQKGTEELRPKHLGEILTLFTCLWWVSFKLCPGLFFAFLWESRC